MAVETIPHSQPMLAEMPSSDAHVRGWRRPGPPRAATGGGRAHVPRLGASSGRPAAGYQDARPKGASPYLGSRFKVCAARSSYKADDAQRAQQTHASRRTPISCQQGVRQRADRAADMTTPKERIGIQLQPLTEQQKEQAREELRETPENVEKGVAELRELLRADPTLHYRDDDEFLIRFLRPTKFYPKSALELMRRAAVFKDKHSDLLRDLLPTDEEDAFVNHTVVNVLADRDQKGRRVLFVNCGGSWDPSKVSSNQMFKLFYLIHEGAMLEPQTQVAGVVVVMDFKNMGLKQVRGLSPAFSMLLLSFIQDAIPLRLKEVHIVKQPYVFNMVFTMFKPFIREKLKSRMFFHGDKMESLHKYLDPSHLPEDYGGKLPKIDYTSKDWYPVICDITDEIKEWNSYGLVKQSK